MTKQYTAADIQAIGGASIVAALVATVLLFLIVGWGLMIGLGILHGIWAAVPPLGYWTCVGILVALRFIIVAFRIILK